MTVNTSVAINWLLAGEPFIRYRTLVDLLGQSEHDREVIETRQQISEHPLIRALLDRRNPDGYWGIEKDIHAWFPRKDTTFWVIGVLGDFGLKKGDRGIETACEYVFSTQHPFGGFGWSTPTVPADCFTGILTESLAKLGYGEDPRLKLAYRWMIQRQRLYGGFWCKNTGQPGGLREHEPSCAFATVCVLGALVRNPELKDSPMARQSAEFLLGCWDRRGKIRYAGHDSQIGTGWEKLKYPFTDYRILKYLDTISRVESVRSDSRIGEMVDGMMAKGDKEGRFCAESIHKAWSDFDFGQKAMPSRWVTFLVYRIL
jgi:hypothetical protein